MSVRKHTGYNLAGTLVPLALALATVPTYIHLIGDARYGVLAIAWLLLGYFGLFDLGVGAALSQKIAALGDKSDQQSEAHRTALVVNTLLGVLGGAALWPISLILVERVFSIDPGLRSELLQALPLLAVGVPIATISSVFSGTLAGQRHFLDLNIITTIGASLSQVLPLGAAILFGAQLSWLIAAVLLSRILSSLLMYWRCKVHLKTNQRVAISRSNAISLLRFGGWVSISSLIAPIMSGLDRLAIGTLLGASAVTFYTVPFQLAERMVVFPNALCTALLPRFAIASEAERQSILSSAIAATAALMTPMVVLALLLIGPFLSWWISPAFALESHQSAGVLLLSFWVVSLTYIPYAELRGSGRPHVIANCHLAELLPYLALLYVGLRWGGLPGAAGAFFVRGVADCLLLMHFAKVPKQTLVQVMGASLLPGFALAFSLIMEAGTVGWFVGAVVLAVLSALNSAIVLPAHLRAELLQFLRSLRVRLTRALP